MDEAHPLAVWTSETLPHVKASSPDAHFDLDFSVALPLSRAKSESPRVLAGGKKHASDAACL